MNQTSHIDLFLVRSPYHSSSFSVHPSSNYLGPVGQYDFLLLSGAPPKTKDYLALIWVFDGYTWACLLITLVAVSILLILINKISECLLNLTTEPTHKGDIRLIKIMLQSVNRQSINLFIHLFFSYLLLCRGGH